MKAQSDDARNTAAPSIPCASPAPRGGRSQTSRPRKCAERGGRSGPRFSSSHLGFDAVKRNTRSADRQEALRACEPSAGAKKTRSVRSLAGTTHRAVIGFSAEEGASTHAPPAHAARHVHDALSSPRLEGDDWPGNVRDLETVVKPAMIRRRAGWLTPGDVVLPKLRRDRLPESMRTLGISLTPAQEQALRLASSRGEVRRGDLMASWGISREAARRALLGLERAGAIRREGSGRGAPSVRDSHDTSGRGFSSGFLAGQRYLPAATLDCLHPETARVRLRPVKRRAMV